MSASPSLHPARAARRRSSRLLSLAAGAFLVAAGLSAVLSPLGAATFCVASSAELQNALDTAASNGVDDVIHLRKGTYAAPGGGFKYLSSQADDLTLVGGYIVLLGGCTRLETSPFGTVLNGGGQERVLSFSVALGAGGSGSPHLRVDGLKLTNGDGGFGDSGVGLSVVVTPATVNPTVEVIGSAFTGNVTQGAVGGLDISVGNSATVRVVGNLFVDNHGLGLASALSIYGLSQLDAAVTNNTFTDNGGGTAVVALSLPSATGTAWASNNIVWANGGDYDFGLYSAGTTALVANDYPRPLNALPSLEVDRYQVDPKFIDPASNWDLRPDSPLSGRGATPPYGGFGTRDLLGRPRVAGAYVDLGAYEIQNLLSDGFESGTFFTWSAKKP